MKSAWFESALCQVKSVAAVITMAFAQGMAIGWSSPALKKFGKDDGPSFAITSDESSWIVSLFDLGMMVGAWVSTLVFTRAGRRLTITVGPTVLLLWVLLTFFATSPAMLMVARLLGGAGQGIVMSFCFIYIGETASANMRGILILATTMMLPAGQLVAYIYGTNIDFKWQAIAPLPVVLLIFVFIFFFLEETPFFLSMKGRHDDMLRVLRRLRKGVPDEEIEAEGEAIRKAVEKQQTDASTWREAFKPPGIKYGSFLVLVISSSFALVGVSTVLAYTIQIFDKSGAPIEESTAAIVVLAVKVVMVFCAMFAIERLGRRLQLTLASLGNAIAMGGMCAFMIIKEQNGVDTSNVSWVPLVLMILYISCTGLGVNAVPQVLMSELLGQRVKAILAPVIMTFVSITSFFCNKYFRQLGENPGFYAPFAFFAATNLFIAIFTLLLVPETKGKTIAEVQEMLRSRNHEKKERL